jgi:hypothetical protein
LVSYATRRRAGMEAREAEDVVNDFGRDPIGEGQEERVSHVFSLLLTGPEHAMCSTYRSTTGSSETFWTTHGTTPHRSRRSANVIPVRWALSNLAVTKMGNKGDLNSKNSHDSRWSNGSGKPGVVVGNTQFRAKTLFMICMYFTLNEMQLWLILSELK